MVKEDQPFLLFPQSFLSCQKKIQSFAQELTLYHTVPTFTDLETRSLFENIVGKGENAGNHYSHNVFYPSQSKFQFLSRIYFVVCKKPSIWTSLYFCHLVKSSVFFFFFFCLQYKSFENAVGKGFPLFPQFSLSF